MAERDSWATTGGIDQQDARMAIGALWTPGSTAISAKTGFRPGPGAVTPGTVYASGTPDGNVHVQPFQAVLQTTRATPGGPYILTLDAVKDINILSTPAHATNPRNDLIIAHQSDTFHADGDSLLRVRQIVGTPSGTPADPSLAAYPDAITLARVRVDANATTIVSGKITDLRPTALYTVGVGGIVPVASQAARDALTGVYDGYAAWRQDRDWVETYDGTAWRVQGLPVVSSSADLSAITNPHTGLVASCTGDGMLYRYNGSAWRVHGLYRATQAVTGSAVASVTFSSIPTYLRNLRLDFNARTTAVGMGIGLSMRINGVSAASNYAYSTLQVINVTPNYTVSSVGTDRALIGTIAGASTGANDHGAGHVDFVAWNGPHTRYLNWTGQSYYYESGANSALNTFGGLFFDFPPFTSLTFFCETGNIDVGSVFTLTGSE